MYIKLVINDIDKKTIYAWLYARIRYLCLGLWMQLKLRVVPVQRARNTDQTKMSNTGSVMRQVFPYKLEIKKALKNH